MIDQMNEKTLLEELRKLLEPTQADDSARSTDEWRLLWGGMANTRARRFIRTALDQGLMERIPINVMGIDGKRKKVIKYRIISSGESNENPQVAG